jgi:hypothetical protein
MSMKNSNSTYYSLCVCVWICYGFDKFMFELKVKWRLCR